MPCREDHAVLESIRVVARLEHRWTTSLAIAVRERLRGKRFARRIARRDLVDSATDTVRSARLECPVRIAGAPDTMPSK